MTERQVVEQRPLEGIPTSRAKRKRVSFRKVCSTGKRQNRGRERRREREEFAAAPVCHISFEVKAKEFNQFSRRRDDRWDLGKERRGRRVGRGGERVKEKLRAVRRDRWEGEKASRSEV